MSNFTTAPLHTPSVERLAAEGLSFELVDTADRGRFAPWMSVLSRGFAGGEHDTDEVNANLAGLASRRTSGVYDPAGHRPADPVGTVNSWPARLTVPGERDVAAWAISCVTVAATHRRRGIARAMLEAELATASSQGIPIVMLTVSESTIYGRFGFAPAAMAATWTIDTRRAHWAGPPTTGRVDYVPLDEWRAEFEPFWARVRLASPGQVDGFPLRWDQFVGIGDSDKERTRSLRAVRHTDDNGILRGLALYRIRGGDDFVAQKADVELLVSETPDAYAALWRFLLELDLVRDVVAELRSVDEPLRWQISDWRAAKVSTYDHQWLRILDVPAALSARAYAAPGRLVVEVADPFGYAEGRWMLTVGDNGSASVEPVDTNPDGTPALSLSVNELSALYLGGVRATELVDARRATELHPGSAVAADAILRSERTPWLGIWY